LNAQPTLMDQSDWRQEPRRQMTGESVIELNQTLSRPIRKMPLWHFVGSDGSRVISTRPVNVEVHRELADDPSAGNAYVVGCAKLHVYASAASLDVAISAFVDQVVHFFGSGSV